MNLETILFDHFGYQSFKDGQKEVIENLLLNQNTFAMLPTGTGKSLCYQFIGAVKSGKVIVVSPLLSLMEDQVLQLQKLGNKRGVAINSQLSMEEKNFVLQHINDYEFIFLSPETLVQKRVKSCLMQCNIALFVVDEAHCVSQWGIDFRPEYLSLQSVLRELNFPLTLALTATATKEVRDEIYEQLFSKDTRPFQSIIASVDRKNIVLNVTQTSDKKQQLLTYLKKFSANGLIYCATRKTTEQVCQLIQEKTNLNVAFYHGGLSVMERTLLQQQFIQNQLDLLCATNAFGMGINKPDIRYVIHYDLPNSLENYLQEIGRAGRDQKPSLAVLLYQNGDETIHHFFQEEAKVARRAFQSLTTLDQNDLNMTELQQKWLTGVLEKNYTLKELQKKLQAKEHSKQQQLHTMLAYIKTPTCRRNFIQNYFEEEIKTVKQVACCDNCGSSFDDILESITTLPKSPVVLLHWQEILLKLFKESK